MEKSTLYQERQQIPAICGAVFFTRKCALEEVMIKGNEVFDSSFYMYKEDIDLSLRLKKKGWGLYFVPDLVCYHCRGWSRDRKDMPRRFRLCSAKNEMTIQWKRRNPIALFYSLGKYCLVRWFDL
jgi:GT2 family glycosyltransferase